MSDKKGQMQSLLYYPCVSKSAEWHNKQGAYTVFSWQFPQYFFHK